MDQSMLEHKLNRARSNKSGKLKKDGRVEM